MGYSPLCADLDFRRYEPCGFLFVRWQAGYGDKWLHRSNGSWQQWLRVGKYPPSLTYYMLELGILFLALALLRTVEMKIGENRVFLVFGQTAMFFYPAHRLMFEVPATYFGLRGFGNLTTTYVAAAIMLVLLYPACRWYRGFKLKHRDTVLRFI
jgi:hypothetical protein